MKRIMVAMVFCLSLCLAPVWAQESVMSVGDTVKWAKERSLKDQPISNSPPLLNPVARETLYGILVDPQQRSVWPSVVYAFRYVGQSEDVPRLMKWIEGFKGESFDSSSIDIVVQAQRALGIMNRRGVDGARALCDKMMSPDYWRDLGILITGDYNPVKNIGGSEYYLAMHGAVANIYSLDLDFRKKIQKIAEGIADPKARSEYGRETANILADYDAHMADGLFAWQRLGRDLAEERAKRAAQKGPRKPSPQAYIDACTKGVLDKVTLDAGVRDRLVREALEAYAVIAADLLQGKREETILRLATGTGPLVLKGSEPAERAATLAQDAENSVCLDQWQALLKDLANCHLDEASATVKICLFDLAKKSTVDAAQVAAEPQKHADMILVQIPFTDAEALKETHPLPLDHRSPLTKTGEKETVTLCMLLQAGNWYWVGYGN